MQNLRTKTWLILALVLIGAVCVLPSVGIELPGSLKKILPADKIHLGLDLQGGMHLVLGVKTEKAVESSLDQNIADIKDEIRKAGIRYRSVKPEEGYKLRVTLSSPEYMEKLNTVLENYYQFESKTWKENGDAGAVLTLKKREINRIREYAVSQSLETIRNRIDEFGVSEPTIQRQGADHILVQLPGIKDTQRAIKLIGKTALLEFKMLDHENSLERALAGDIPEGSEILYEKDVDPATGKITKTPYLLKKATLMTGDVITDARVGIDNQYGDSYVTMTFNKRGTRLFARITEANVKKRMAIILDKNVYSAPTIQEKIAGGKAQITGRFTPEEAHDLAIVLRAGSLPAPVEILEERTVGPSLGKDSIEKGLKSIMIGGLIVVIFMVVYYKLSGIVANLALVLNILFMMAALAAFKATLTLPGIAGIVLTIGMAVDANVLIFERIREELALGKTVRAAVDSGYSKAFLTILDANITTLIAAIVLFQFGTGPIKGFAVTLSLGIIASMFTAIIVTRVIFDLVLQNRRVTKLSI